MSGGISEGAKIDTRAGRIGGAKGVARFEEISEGRGEAPVRHAVSAAMSVCATPQPHTPCGRRAWALLLLLLLLSLPVVLRLALGDSIAAALATTAAARQWTREARIHVFFYPLFLPKNKSADRDNKNFRSIIFGGIAPVF